MSDTPRTDEAAKYDPHCNLANFSRQLEREIAEAKQELADYKYSMGQSEMQKIHMLQMCEIKCDQLERELAEANAKLRSFEHYQLSMDAAVHCGTATDQQTLAHSMEMQRMISEQWKHTADLQMDELRTLRRDKERLDWLNTVDGMDWFGCLDYAEATREAIDAAMKGEAK